MTDIPASIPTPSSLGLPHEEWRPHQYEACQWANDIEDIGLMQASTGSGKSAIAAYLSRFKRAPVLTRTKSLQFQYEEYGGYVIMGRGNYPCIHPDNQGETCDACLFAEMGMSRCDHNTECVYLNRKYESFVHPFPSANYALWLCSPAFRNSRMPIQQLVLDECHLLSDITLEWAGATINEEERREYELPSFPIIKSANLQGVQDATAWLASAQERAHDNWVQLKISSNADDPMIKAKLRKLERIGMKIKATVESLQHCPADWFIKAGPGVCYRRGPLPGVRIRPLTAKYSFPRFFMGEWKALLMSATVGNFDAFADELGIPLSDRLRVPSNFPPSTRPVYILDAPRLNYQSTDEDYEKQADVIADAIKMCPPEWSGMIHVTRKSEAPLIAQRLSLRGLQDRVWVPPRKIGHKFAGTREQMSRWEHYRDANPGAIFIGWQAWEGIDGRNEKICIVAKCFTKDVKLLGPQGTISMDSARLGDKVFALDRDGYIVKSKILNVIKKHYAGKMIRFRSRKYDVTVTPDHRMIYKTSNDVRNKKNTDWPIVPANEIKSSYGYFPVSAKTRGQSGKALAICFESFFNDDTYIWYRPRKMRGRWSDNGVPAFMKRARTTLGYMYTASWKEVRESDWRPGLLDVAYFGDTRCASKFPYYVPMDHFVRFAGWFIAEGYSSNYTGNRQRPYQKIGITQKEGNLLDSFAVTLDCMRWHYSRSSKKKGAQDITISSAVLYRAFSSMFGKGAKSKKIPRFLLDEGSYLLSILMNALIDGDGNAARDTYSTSSPKLRDGFVELCLNLGYAPSVNEVRDGHCHIYFSKRNLATVNPQNNVEEIDYDGDVWCVTTEHGTVLATRNGKFVFTGQCPFPSTASEYERQRRQYSNQFYSQRTAWALQQALGRTRRGRPEDYDTEDEMRGFVAIADGSYKRVVSYLDDDFVEALTEI